MPHLLRHGSVTRLALASVTQISSAFAEGHEPDRVEAAPEPRNVRLDIPTLAYTYAAAGMYPRTIGITAYGLGLVDPRQDSVLGRGCDDLRTPFNGLTLVADGSRDETGRFAPSFAAFGRFFGRPGRGISLSGMVKFKVEGFGVAPVNSPNPPDGDVESELEGGVLVGFVTDGWHFDANGVGGAGLNDEGEVDMEGRLRLGRDLGPLVRIGLDGQFRVRAHGTETLAGGRTADFATGGQFLVGGGDFYATATAGPSTVNVAQGVGFATIVAAGGVI